MGPEVARCRHCGHNATAWDHSACAFISDLAAMRGISFAQARADYNEANLIDVTEAKILGAPVDEPAPAMPMFVIETCWDEVDG